MSQTGRKCKELDVDLPRPKGSRKRIQQALLRFIDLRDPQNIINIADNCQARSRNQIRRSISQRCTLDISIERLNFLRLVSIQKSIALNGHKNVEIALICRRIRQCDLLTATRAHGLQLNGRNVHITLLQHKNLRRQIPRLTCLRRRQILNIHIWQKHIRQIIQRFPIRIRLLVNISVKPNIPSLICPIRVWRDIENLSWKGRDLRIVYPKRRLDAIAGGKVLKEVGNSFCNIRRDGGTELAEDGVYVAGELAEDVASPKSVGSRRVVLDY